MLRADFEKMEDWLYEEGRDLSSKEYNSKKELEAQVAPIFLRLAEMEARPPSSRSRTTRSTGR